MTALSQQFKTMSFVMHESLPLTFLLNTYSTITLEVVEQNHNNFTTKWNPDDRIETIFKPIKPITAMCQFAPAISNANVISESTTIYLAHNCY
jgi:hypothetical protein